MVIGTHLCVINFPHVMEQLGVVMPQSSMRDNIQTLLDGLGWRPLRSEWDYDATHKRILREIFAEEGRRGAGVRDGGSIPHAQAVQGRSRRRRRLPDLNKGPERYGPRKSGKEAGT